VPGDALVSSPKARTIDMTVSATAPRTTALARRAEVSAMRFT
jgi:hypothetical protein